MFPFVLLAMLVISAFVAVYVLLIRPYLKSLPILAGFYTEADTFLGKAWALVHRSATVAWSYILLAAGTVFNQLDTVAAAVGDPDLKTQVSSFFSADAKTLSYFLMGTALVTLAARLRSITKPAA
jgi:hypothetical protein